MKLLEDIFAQDQAITRLRGALEAQRMPHGLIFAGPTGVGKYTTSLALARIFLCEHPSEPARACGECQSCRLMAAGTHPDFHRVYRQLVRLDNDKLKARDLSVKVIREYLIDPSNLMTSMGRGKVFVIEESELMNASAQNAMLKTLEEPLGRTLIILLTDQPGVLLPTIRSRCQLIPFMPIDSQTVMAKLKDAGVDAARAERAAFFAAGSLGLAMRWLDEGVIDKSDELRQQIESMLGHRGSPDLSGWFKKAADEYSAKQLEKDPNASKEQTTHDGLGVYLGIASHLLSEKLTGESDADRLERICQAIDAIAAAEINLNSNVTVSLVLMQLSMALERELTYGCA